MMTRLLSKAEPIPYDLLLLADETEQAIDKYIFDAEIYVYEKDSEMIALYTLRVINSEVIELDNIAVREVHQGKGIGKALLTEASARAEEKGFKTIVIGTGDVLMMQLYLYQKMGFEMYTIKKNFYLDSYPRPIYDNGMQLRHMVMLKKELR